MNVVKYSFLKQKIDANYAFFVQNHTNGISCVAIYIMASDRKTQMKVNGRKRKRSAAENVSYIKLN